MSFPSRARAGRGRRGGLGLPRGGRHRARADAAGRAAGPRDRRRRRPAATGPRVHQRPVPRIGGLAIVVGILVPARDLRRPRRALPRDPGRDAAASRRSASSTTSAASSPSAKMLGVVRGRADPGASATTSPSTTSTLPVVGDYDLGWAAYPLTILWIAVLANLVNLIDGMDALAAGIVAIAAASFAILAASFGRVERRRAGGDRLRRDARVPAPQLPPGEDLHGRLRRARARVPARARWRSRAS